MKKIVFLINSMLICVAMFVSCSYKATKPNAQKTYWENNGLKGNVKSLKTISYAVMTDLGQLRKGEIIEDTWGYYNTLVKINEKGNWTEYSSYKPDGTNIRLEISKYDSEENPLEMVVYNYGKIEHRRVFTTDKNGNITEMLRFDANDSLVLKSLHQFDKNNYEIQSYRYNATDSLTSKTVSNYNESGNLIERFNYGADESLTTKTLYKYDNLGNITERTIFGSDENLIEKTIYQYNEKSLETEKNTFNPKNNSNTKTTYKYEKYDKKYNWIERIEYKDDVAVKITEREIEYHE